MFAVVDHLVGAAVQHGAVFHGDDVILRIDIVAPEAGDDTVRRGDGRETAFGAFESATVRHVDGGDRRFFDDNVKVVENIADDRLHGMGADPPRIERTLIIADVADIEIKAVVPHLVGAAVQHGAVFHGDEVILRPDRITIIIDGVAQFVAVAPIHPTAGLDGGGYVRNLHRSDRGVFHRDGVLVLHAPYGDGGGVLTDIPRRFRRLVSRKGNVDIQTVVIRRIGVGVDDGAVFHGDDHRGFVRIAGIFHPRFGLLVPVGGSPTVSAAVDGAIAGFHRQDGIFDDVDGVILLKAENVDGGGVGADPPRIIRALIAGPSVAEAFAVIDEIVLVVDEGGAVFHRDGVLQRVRVVVEIRAIGLGLLVPVGFLATMDVFDEGDIVHHDRSDRTFDDGGGVGIAILHTVGGSIDGAGIRTDGQRRLGALLQHVVDPPSGAVDVDKTDAVGCVDRAVAHGDADRFGEAFGVVIPPFGAVGLRLPITVGQLDVFAGGHVDGDDGPRFGDDKVRDGAEKQNQRQRECHAFFEERTHKDPPNQNLRCCRKRERRYIFII